MANHVALILLLLAPTLQGCREGRFDEDREVVIEAVLLDDRPLVLAATGSLGVYVRSESDTTRLIEPDQWDVKLYQWAINTGSLTLEDEHLSYYVTYTEADGEVCLAYGAVEVSTLRLVRSEPCNRSHDWSMYHISSEYILDGSVVTNIYFEPVAGQLVNRSRLVARVDLTSGEVHLTDISGAHPTFYGDGLAYVAAIPPNIGWVVVRSGGSERRVFNVGSHPRESIRSSRNGLFILYYPSGAETITYVEDLGGSYVTRGSVTVETAIGMSTTSCAGRDVVTYTEVYDTWDLAAYVAYWDGERMVKRRVEEADRLFGPPHPEAATCRMLGLDVEYEGSHVVRVDLSAYVEGA